MVEVLCFLLKNKPQAGEKAPSTIAGHWQAFILLPSTD
jgi:hypothetical protein